MKEAQPGARGNVTPEAQWIYCFCLPLLFWDDTEPLHLRDGPAVRAEQPAQMAHHNPKVKLEKAPVVEPVKWDPDDQLLTSPSLSPSSSC